jgi:putative membrane protein
LYRIGFFIVTGLAVLFGLLVGTLNSDNVNVDLLWVQLDWPLGLLLLSAMVLGLLVGQLLLWLMTIVPLRMQLRKMRGSADRTTGQSLSAPRD